DWSALRRHAGRRLCALPRPRVARRRGNVRLPGRPGGERRGTGDGGALRHAARVRNGAHVHRRRAAGGDVARVRRYDVRARLTTCLARTTAISSRIAANPASLHAFISMYAAPGPRRVTNV